MSPERGSLKGGSLKSEGKIPIYYLYSFLSTL
jgi:hypothetical protein